jgi:hypothetical protein
MGRWRKKLCRPCTAISLSTMPAISLPAMFSYDSGGGAAYQQGPVDSAFAMLPDLKVDLLLVPFCC